MATQPVSLDLLQFGDSTSCRQWIATLPLTNIPAAQHSLARQIALAAQAELPPAELLKTLEVLREPVIHVQQEAAVKYAGKALPLESSELAGWKRTVALWKELARAYLVCRDMQLHGEPGLKSHGALLSLRCLQYTGRAMFEHYRIHHQPPAALWRELHRFYAVAEQNHFARSTVSGPLDREEADTNCMATYCHVLLLHLANPFALTARQLDFVDQWLGDWASLVDLTTEAPPPSATPLLAADLAGDNAPAPAQSSQLPLHLRYLNLEQLGRGLLQTIAHLKQGQTPAELGLGEARQPGCESLLTLLYIQWCRAGTSRGEQRDAGAEKARVCLGIHAIHFHVSGGRAFRAPGSSLSRQEEQDLQLFGRISERTERMLASEENIVIEPWQLINHSDAGFMCMLREPDAHVRVGHNQLIAVQRAGAPFRVGVVQWLRAEENNELFIGVRLFPGTAHAIAVRPVNFKLRGADTYERALLLPESTTMPALPLMLILPLGWYQAGRFIDIFYGEQKRVAKLEGLFEKGSDFDRCIISLS